MSHLRFLVCSCLRYISWAHTNLCHYCGLLEISKPIWQSLHRVLSWCQQEVDSCWLQSECLFSRSSPWPEFSFKEATAANRCEQRKVRSWPPGTAMWTDYFKVEAKKIRARLPIVHLLPELGGYLSSLHLESHKRIVFGAVFFVFSLQTPFPTFTSSTEANLTEEISLWYLVLNEIEIRKWVTTFHCLHMFESRCHFQK